MSIFYEDLQVDCDKAFLRILQILSRCSFFLQSGQKQLSNFCEDLQTSKMQTML